MIVRRVVRGVPGALGLLCLSVASAVAQVEPPPPSPNASMAEVAAWIEHAIPPLGTDTRVTTNGASTSSTKYAIEFATLSDCRLTVRASTQTNTYPPSLSVNTVTLRDIDLASLLPLQRPIRSAPGAGESRPFSYRRIVALRDRGEPFTYESGTLHERTDLITLYFRDQFGATKAADAL